LIRHFFFGQKSFSELYDKSSQSDDLDEDDLPVAGSVEEFDPEQKPELHQEQKSELDPEQKSEQKEESSEILEISKSIEKVEIVEENSSKEE
jgi:hypothetical protein